jgi:hypothetical protein
MKNYSAEIPFIISKFKHHTQLKDKVLELINSSEGNHIVVDDNETISRSDWNLTNSPKLYWQLIFPYIEEHMINVFSLINYDDTKFANAWFQQYKKTDVHGWHRHHDVFWANVYYVELPKDAPGTVFKNILKKGEFIYPDVREGDILTFPAMIDHCSPPNQSLLTKTIISFNMT